MATYLLGTSSAKLTLRIGIVHVTSTEHLRRLTVSLVRILLCIPTHVGRVHLRPSVLTVRRAHAAMLHAVIWGRHLLLSLLWWNLACRSLTARGGTFRGGCMARFFTGNNVDEEVEHVTLRQRGCDVTSL